MLQLSGSLLNILVVLENDLHLPLQPRGHHAHRGLLPLCWISALVW